MLRGYLGDAFGSVVRSGYGAAVAPARPAFQRRGATSPCGPGYTYLGPQYGCVRTLPGSAVSGLAGFGIDGHMHGYFGDDGDTVVGAGEDDAPGDSTALGPQSSGSSGSTSSPFSQAIAGATGAAISGAGASTGGGSGNVAVSTGAGSSSSTSTGSGINWTSVITGAETAASALIGAATGNKVSSGSSSSSSKSGGSSSTASSVGTVVAVGVGLGALFLLLK